MNGKGDKQRPMSISKKEYDKKYKKIFKNSAVSGRERQLGKNYNSLDCSNTTVSTKRIKSNTILDNSRNIFIHSNLENHRTI